MEQNIRNIFNLASDAYIIFNEEGEILDVNSKACQMYGYSYQEFLKLKCWDIVHPDYYQLFEKFIEGINIKGEYINESKDIKKNGAVIDVELKGTEFKYNGLTHYLAIVRDISIRKEEELLMKEFFDYQLQLIDELPCLIWKTDSEGYCNYFNNRWLEFTGKSMDEEIKYGGMKNIHSADFDYFRTAFEKAFKDGEPMEMEYRLQRHDGVFRWIVNYARPFKDLEGEFAGYIGACWDISERKRMEQTLLKQKDTLQEELEVAASVQQQMLPEKQLKISNIEFAWQFQPCVYVAGDMFNFVQIDEENVCFYMLDVKGHGAHAALKAVILNYYIKNLLNETYYPARVLKHLENFFNNELDGVLRGDLFTIFYGIINIKELKLTYCRAGHQRPILISRDHNIKELKYGEPAIGLASDLEYNNYIQDLSSGDKIILFTDGVVEAQNKNKEFYTKEGLKNHIKNNNDIDLDKLIKAILEDVKRHKGDQDIRDDLTILGIEIS